ncbi:MAG: hypothetical protein AAF694_30250 [Bacteroidota bacterium]
MRNSHIYKKFLFLFSVVFLLQLLTPGILLGQAVPVKTKMGKPKHSFLGHVHTPKGNLHMLLIIVRYKDVSKMNSKAWPDVTKEGVLPDMAKGKTNGLFTGDASKIGSPDSHKNLSDYFYKMSGGKFRVSGDIFPVQVPVTYIPPNRLNFYSRQVQMNKEAIQWIAENYPNFDWSTYDQRKNSPKFQSDNSESQPDQILDYVIFMHREKGSNGAGSPGAISIPNSRYKIRDGHTGVKSYDNAPHNWLFFKHEFAHTLFKCPHYLGANSANGQHFYTQKGWGLMSAWHAPFFTANAWECWWLGWLEPQEITESGVYQLKDFVVGRDAIRIRVPGSQDYLWLENHQKKDPFWDRKQFFYKDQEKGESPSQAGIYAYVVGSPGSDRSKPSLNPFNTRHANMIKMYNGEGNYDIEDTGERKSNGFFDVAVMRKAQPNPFSGQNDFQFIRRDFDQDGKILARASHGNRDEKSGEQKGVWAEKREASAVLTFGNTGDGNDAFDLGDEIGLSGIVPVTNYPIYDSRKQRFNPYFINGITLRILSEDAEGTMTLEVKFDDWELRKSQRWCGNLLMKDFSGSTQNTERLIRIPTRVSLDLALSGTAQRTSKHPETGTFANPTILVIEKGKGFRVEKRGSLRIDPYSTIILKPGAKLILEKKARLDLKGTLHIEEGASLEVNRRAIFSLSEESTLTVDGEYEAQVKMRGKMEDNRVPVMEGV